MRPSRTESCGSRREQSSRHPPSRGCAALRALWNRVPRLHRACTGARDSFPASELLALAAAAALVAGCSITREYIGSPLRADPDREIRAGSTDMAQVLHVFGAPDRILRHTTGDVFVYRYRRSNTEVLSIEEPVITNTEIFTYSRTREKEDRLVVLFDREGLVRSFGFIRGTAELERKRDP